VRRRAQHGRDLERRAAVARAPDRRVGERDDGRARGRDTRELVTAEADGRARAVTDVEAPQAVGRPDRHGVGRPRERQRARNAAGRADGPPARRRLDPFVVEEVLGLDRLVLVAEPRLAENLLGRQRRAVGAGRAARCRALVAAAAHEPAVGVEQRDLALAQHGDAIARGDDARGSSREDRPQLGACVARGAEVREPKQERETGPAEVHVASVSNARAEADVRPHAARARRVLTSATRTRNPDATVRRA
jgi:hypothetical protein